MLSADALHALLSHRWPGNVRELRNLMTYLAATVEGPLIELLHLKEPLGLAASLPTVERSAASQQFRPIAEEVRELEDRADRAAIEAAGGNHTRAAALIQMPLRTFQAKAKQYNLTARARPKSSD